MAITLYELAAANPAIRFSPYCWRTRLALAHKQLEVEALPWHFTEVERLAFSGQSKVPVIVDGSEVVSDSWNIALYLETAYPERPSLFGGSGGQAHAAFVNGWADSVLNPGISGLIVADILPALRPEDQGYFRTSRERAFGRKLEDVIAGRDTRVEAWRAMLAPVRWVLRRQPWLGGEQPDYADYIVLGSLQWPRCISTFALLEADDPVQAWLNRGLALFGGLAREAPTV